jgi:hypothetical protein
MFYPNDNPYSPTQSFTKEDILSFAMSDAASLHVFLTYVVCSLKEANFLYSRLKLAYPDPPWEKLNQENANSCIFLGYEHIQPSQP